jgi:predicted alpha/beta-fold hydrolase
MNFEPFHPPSYLANAYTQTFLASLKIRTLGSNPLVCFEKHVVLETSMGTRLSGYYSPQNASKPKGMAILLHGWEGSSHSTYILQCGKHLYRNGYAVFRLNFRDHGASHHLNEGLFYATLLDEVFEGVQLASRFCENIPVFLVGFSLGGNFAIRIAARYSTGGYHHLSRAVSISPVLDPSKATDRIDGNSFIRGYFLKKWRNSLILKQRLFPNTYDFKKILKLTTLRKMTDELVHQYTNFADAHAYFRSYTISPESTEHLALPLTIISAVDDPIIPADDFYALKITGETDLILHEHGGHNGFLEGIFRPAWYDGHIVRLIAPNQQEHWIPNAR